MGEAMSQKSKHPRPRPFWDRSLSNAYLLTRTFRGNSSEEVTFKTHLNDMLPHSKEAGFAPEDIYRHTKDAYANHWPAEDEWHVPDREGRYKYLQHIKDLSGAWPHLRFLAQWMEVTTSPIKWEQLKSIGVQKDMYLAERAARTKVAVVDFSKDGTAKVVSRINHSDILLETLQTPQPEEVSRLYVVEDLSRDMIEDLGRELDIDPLFFREHINDYLWYNILDPWVELPDLDIVSRERNFFRLSYVQPRYFKDQHSFQGAKEEIGRFNVLRRLDDDSNHKAVFDAEKGRVALLRSKASLWIKPREKGDEKGFTGVLLIDPSITKGHALWGGYRPFWNSPTYSQRQDTYEWQQKSSVFEDLLFWITQMTKQDVEGISKNPKAMMFRMAQIICADWNILIRYITARLGQIEWELERPDFRPNSNTSVAASLGKLHTWRRRLPLYKTMVKEAQEKLFGELITGPEYTIANSVSTHPPVDDCLSKLKKDFNMVAAELVELWDRTERIATVATAVTSIEESRSAMDQNRALGRLTYLAVIFAPLSFISSFFSMAPELGELTTTIWIYFVVAVPVSIIAFLLVEPSVLKWLKSFLPDHPSKEKKN